MAVTAAKTDAAVPRLVMQNISKTFGPIRALQDVSLRVMPGEVHALMGENGAGKSTLMRILAGAIAADADGQIEIDGRAAQGMADFWRGRLPPPHPIFGWCKTSIRSAQPLLQTTAPHRQRYGRNSFDIF